ncbi:hypothetical protein JZ751_009700 [Albula glossodonta]|uniref:3-hydroxyisobutyrate dehydrogenase, mitochondrial n=1 Tax=Albula glossodonta TaxID=121402 RepID=A0A8T2P960_9TELE|nr:hypothetical protein JZ751_009700 [Albula glossodonta]
MLKGRAGAFVALLREFGFLWLVKGDGGLAWAFIVLARTVWAVFPLQLVPVFGLGVGAASSAKLTFMVGGAEEEFNAAKELLSCMGANVVYCGQVGTGQVNTPLHALTHLLGLDPKLLAKILNMSSGRCWSSDTYNPVPGVMEGVPSGNNYQGGFGTTLMAKDLGLAQNTATNTKTPIPLGALAHQIYRMMCARGYAGKDFSSVFQFLREDEGQSPTN